LRNCRKVTGYRGIKHDIENAGGTFVDADVVVDGNIFSGKTWRELPEFMRELIKVIKEKVK